MKRYMLFVIAIVQYLYLFAQEKKEYHGLVVAFYNLENLYDTIKHPKDFDDEFTPLGARKYNSKIYYDKLNKLASVIASLGSYHQIPGPALLGVAEIENESVLVDLVQQPALQHLQLGIVHYDSRDRRGIDVGLLYQTKLFRPIQSKSLPVMLPDRNSFITRDILWVEGMLMGERVHIYVCHWPSRRGGEKRSASGRMAAAQVVKQHLNSLQEQDPVKAIIMGDFNDDPVSKSIVVGLGAKEDATKLRQDDLYNPWHAMFKKGLGTLAHQDRWGLFDQILVTSSFLERKPESWFYGGCFVHNSLEIIENQGKYKGYPRRTWDGVHYRGGYSDHFPVYILLLQEKKSASTHRN